MKAWRAILGAVAAAATAACVAPPPAHPTAPAAAAGLMPDGPHPATGVWVNFIEGRAGYVRRYRPGGTAAAWYPDGTPAATGRFDVLDSATLVVEYDNGDTEVAHLVEDDILRIEHVMTSRGQHRRYHAWRAADWAAPP